MAAGLLRVGTRPPVMEERQRAKTRAHLSREALVRVLRAHGLIVPFNGLLEFRARFIQHALESAHQLLQALGLTLCGLELGTTQVLLPALVLKHTVQLRR